MVPVPESLSLGNDIGTAKSPETDIPPGLKVKNLQIADELKPISFLFLLYYDLHWDMLRFALWVSVNLPIVINKINVLTQRTIDQSNKTAILIQIWVF